ncbi:MAG TPA: chemotaxis protein CheB [Polyangiales bacterium]|nr:chemotaxis protein CheB [Polyangiales bacterium]
MPHSTPAAPAYVVGIGASAGGLDALERFFDALPEDTGMAFVVIQHLSPDFKSLMDELLARHTRLPIKLVEDGMAVEADHVYLIPPKKEMIISAGCLLLSERERSQELTLPIDVFFRSLARDCGPRAIAIVLSGGGSDGSRGARDIHDAGGMVIVQDVESAQFDGMPKTARDAGVADWVLAPGEMPRALLEHAHERLAGVQPGAGRDRVDDVDVVYSMLQKEFGIDFTHYKPSTVTRRIQRRLALAHSRNIEEYVRHLRNDREELDVLYRDLLIGVTRFFRDEKAYAALEQHVLPELLRRTQPGEPVRIWVAGCATGEEAYSLAILLQDLMQELNLERQVKIFATDVHRGSLEQAARGIYDEQAVANVSAERLARYFFKTGNAYQAVPELRQMIVFAAHDVIKDAPFTRVDLVSCRNLLIYLQPAAQQKALALFHFALNRGGTLFLGPSESTGTLARDFQVLDKHWRIYTKHQDLRLPLDTRVEARRLETRSSGLALQAPARHSLSQLLGTYDALLDEVMPPALLISDHGELIQTFNGASQLLQMRDGRQDLHVYDLVSAELKMLLVGSVKRALNTPGTIVLKGVRLGMPGDERPYKLSLRRIRARNSELCHVLISFEAMESGVPVSASTSETEIDVGHVSGEQLRALEFELNHTKENLQAAIEELESSNEELQASNEELQSANEELQSTNEELQSVNEELYTVNSEYQRKIAELTELTNDMDNLLSSTDIGTIFLDKQLKIRKYTAQIAEAFSLLPQDVGRSIETFAHKLQHPELIEDLKRVLDTAEPVERELDGIHGKAFFSRILPYRTKGTVAGVVLTLIDVTGLKTAEDALFHERYLLNSLLSSVPDAIYFKDSSGRFIRCNHAMAQRLGASDPREVVGKVPFDLPDRELAVALHQADEAVMRTGDAHYYKLERRELPGGTTEWTLASRLVLRDRDMNVVGVIGVFRDVSEQKRAEEKIQEAVRRRDQFLAMLSHELRNPLGAIVSATTLLKSEGDEAEPRARLLGVLSRQSTQMARLLDDLLEASRVTQNKIELRKTQVDLSASAREAADVVREAMQSQQLSFSTHIPEEPLFVDADPARLQQIQINLLSNAAKYTPRGGHVRFELGREDGAALLEVRDDGAGIAKPMLESVFDLFVQSNRTLDRASGGLGVGLTLARALVQLHGGSITADSAGEGLGSSFSVRLPLSASRAEPSVALVKPRLRPGAKIVVVEDNPDSRELLCELLKRAGFDCHTADSGPAALELIDEVQPDIAILDVGLPEMDGYEIARRLREQPRYAKLVLIALTGYGRSSDRTASREAGFDEHLVKPVHADQLLGVLAEMQNAGRERMASRHAPTA